MIQKEVGFYKIMKSESLSGSAVGGEAAFYGFQKILGFLTANLRFGMIGSLFCRSLNSE